MIRLTRRRAAAAALIGLVAGALFWGQLPAIGAGGLLHPARHGTSQPPPEHCESTDLVGVGVTLKGWRCSATAPARGTIVYLHGIADNRGSAVGVIQRFLIRGFDVVAYDSRAHGDSSGDACTYGFFEKQDLRRVIDMAGPGPVVLVGTSLGAAVALQEAADDARVSAVVAAETFSDLRTVASERAPRFFTKGRIHRAFELAEEQAHFRVDAVSPANAAARISIPVLLIHGAADVETSPAHSERVFVALNGPKQLLLVPGARHKESLNSQAWEQIARWIARVVSGGAPQASPWTRRRPSPGHEVTKDAGDTLVYLDELTARPPNRQSPIIYRSRNTSRGKENLPAIESMMLIWHV
jgi:pimeloyl-ACP methyl ester carboxylesterase